MTRHPKPGGKESKRRIISYQPSEANLAFLECERAKGISYKFTLERAIEAHRRRKK